MIDLVAHRRDAQVLVLRQALSVAQSDLDTYTAQLQQERDRRDPEAARYCEGMIAGLQFLVDVIRAGLQLL